MHIIVQNFNVSVVYKLYNLHVCKINFESLKSCDTISADWNCSSGNSQQSVCMRKCSSDPHPETIKCKCKGNLCRWERKGKSCTWVRRLNPDLILASDSSSTETYGNNNRKIENQETKSEADQLSVDSFYGPSNGQAVSENDLSVEPEMMNYSSSKLLRKTGINVASRLNESDQDREKNLFTRFLRDINVSGHMVLNVYNYPSTL